jgi:hypothetical protein
MTNRKSHAPTAELKFWKLQASDQLPEVAEGEFYATLDCASLVVLASSEQEARSIARAESRGRWWLDSKLTTCSPVAPQGGARVVLANWPPLE